MKKIYLFLFSMLFLASFGWGQVSETFSNIGPYGGYQTETWTGDDGGTWTATDARTDQTINGKAITVRNGLLTSPTHSGGVGSLTVTTQRKYSGGTGNMDVKVNGSLVGTIPYDGTQQTTTISNINISGSVTVVIDATNSSSDRVAFDDLSWTAYSGGGGNDTDAEAYDTGDQPAGTSISSLEDTYAERVDVFNMYIGEAGTADGLPTHVTNVRIKPHSSNTADWTDHIQGAVLNDGSSDITATVDITDTYIDFAIASGDLDIANGDFEELTVSIYLNTSGIIENSVLSFMVDADDHGFTADASGTDFMSTFSGGDFNSNDFTVDVEASQLSFLVQPSNVSLDVAMSPDVEIAFTDENSNVDVDYDGAGFGISLTTTGTFSGTATTAVDAVNGVSIFDNIKYSVLGNGITITASDEDGWGNTSAVSNAFNVINVSSTGNIIISEMCDPQENYADDRYIEITNIDDVTIDLTGWSLDAITNDASNVAFTWTLSGTIDPNESLTLGDTDNSVFTPDFAEAGWSSSNSSWNGNEGDGAKLYDGSKALVDNAATTNGGSDLFENESIIRLLSVNGPTTSFTESEWYASGVTSPSGATPGYHINVWTGSSSNSWSTAGNWSQGVSTSELCHAIIPSSASNMPTVSIANEVNGLVIKSDATGDASIIGQQNLTVNGTAIVERYISAISGDNGWHFLSSPVNAMTILGSDFVSGTFDLYRYGETTIADEKWLNYEGGTFGHTEFNNGVGYLYAESAGGVFEFNGDLNSNASYVNTLTYTVGEGEGWNLVGNPYPSGLNWNTISKESGKIGGSYYIIDPSNSTYLTSNGSAGDFTDGYIPPHQGFFVQVTEEVDITMQRTDQVHGADNYEKSNDSFKEELIVELKGSVSSNKTYFSFRDDATNDFDFSLDAEKLFGWATIAQVYSQIGDDQYSINCLPHSDETVTVPLCISLQTDEELTFNFSGMESFFSTIKIELEDKQLGTTQNIMNNPIYTFQATTNDDENRFLLHFNGVTGLEDVASESNIQVYSVDDMIYINSSENLSADILVYNINGQLLYQDVMRGETLKSIQWEASSGIYLVSVVSEETTTTEKVYIK